MNKTIRRIIGLIPAVLLQILWFVILTQWLAPFSALIGLLLSVFAILFVLHIMLNRNEGTYKTLWLLVILGLPVLGTVLYLFFGNKRTTKPIRKNLEKGHASLPEGTKSDPAAEAMLTKEEPRLAQTYRWLEKETGYSLQPIAENKYYPLGEELWAEMLKDLETAKKFIYVEYFIIENGVMWDSMVDIMAKKVTEGVDVRVMYDDMGSISTYNKKNRQALAAKGIQCIAFNPIVALKGTLNYRDHRKMLIIDGRVAYSGGVNLADEYINKALKFGHWKDIGFRLTGKPVETYTRMFATFWNAFAPKHIPAETLQPAPEALAAKPTEGCVLSYYDSPIREDALSNTLYADLLSQATHYAWFYTPYLMLGDTLMDAFVMAAERGVDVRIIMPGVPDKAIVYRMSRSFYQPLLEAGVKIYEYTPGFVHAKGCVIDDKICTIGTVNLDYRSLFLHFENNALFYKAPLLPDLKADFLATQEKSVERTLDNIGNSFRKWLVDGVLRILAPLC